MIITERERKVLRLIAGSEDNGLTASQIVSGTAGWPAADRVWSAQSAAHLARRLADGGYVQPEVWRRMTYYKATPLGRDHQGAGRP